MADISKIKLPNGTIYDVKDATARTTLSNELDTLNTAIGKLEKALEGKAELTDIPTALPASGGNADTVDGKHASEFMQFLGDIRNGSLLDYVLSLNKSGFLYCGGANCTDMPVDGSYFMVEVRCYATIREAIATSFSTGAVYINHYSGTAWFGWHRMADGGNAASVGTYTEAKIAALEARIAALEGK